MCAEDEVFVILLSLNAMREGSWLGEYSSQDVDVTQVPSIAYCSYPSNREQQVVLNIQESTSSPVNLGPYSLLYINNLANGSLFEDWVASLLC